ncbi:cytochrome P450 [Bacillus luti]|uniref:cytochrome P450 n=1 Tax=Bacillus luti TaxID=2026191 RepID=UPI001CEF6968|nr:cytochrome P450 [Bacillus luti]
MESLRPRVQKIADELLDQVQDKGEMDIVKDYAYPLPINVISDMLGVPQADQAQILGWVFSYRTWSGPRKAKSGGQSRYEPSENISRSLWLTNASILLMT